MMLVGSDVGSVVATDDNSDIGMFSVDAGIDPSTTSFII